MTQRYWDLTDIERARLDDEAFDRYCDIELMRAGKVLPPAPERVEPTPVPEMKTKTYYQVTGQRDNGDSYAGRVDLDALFETEEDAQAFIALKPMAQGGDWYSGKTREYIQPLHEYQIKSISLSSREEVESMRAAVDAVEKKNKRHRDAHKEWEKIRNECQDITKALRDDRSACWDMLDNARSLVRVFDRFMELSDDADIALKFLKEGRDLRAILWMMETDLRPEELKESDVQAIRDEIAESEKPDEEKELVAADTPA